MKTDTREDPFLPDPEQEAAIRAATDARGLCEQYVAALKASAAKLAALRETREAKVADLTAADTALALAQADAMGRGSTLDAKAEADLEKLVKRATTALADVDADRERAERVHAALQAKHDEAYVALQDALPAAKDAQRDFAQRVTLALAAELREAAKPLVAAAARAADLAMAVGAMPVVQTLSEITVIDLAEFNAPILARRRAKLDDKTTIDLIDMPRDPSLDGLRAQVQGPRLALNAAAAYRPPVPTAPTKPAAVAGAR